MAINPINSNTGEFESSQINGVWMQHAIEVIYGTYGDVVSVQDKDKDLLKFGRTEEVQTAKTTIMANKTGIYNETYVSTNVIDTLSSSAVADTEPVTVEGHTVDGSGNFTFIVQSTTLTGRNKVVLTTPLARMTRIYNTGASDLVGTVYGYQETAITNGVPIDGTKVHIVIPINLNQSEKCSTTISNNDYWLITSIRGGVIEKTLNYGDFHLEVRLKGGVFRDVQDFTAGSGSDGGYKFEPYLIIPPNADVRLRAVSSANGKEMSGSIQGILATVV